jgi:hypothetical protein
MDREEFRAGILDALEAMKDPNDEIHQMVPEGRALADELRPFDPIMATKVDAIADSIQSLFDYIKSRGELMGNKSTP